MSSTTMAPTTPQEAKENATYPHFLTLCHGSYYQWDDSYKKDFDKWWGKTEIGSDTIGNNKPRPNWDSKTPSAGFWLEFHQCANVQTGEPKICCKSCQKLLAHRATSYGGSSGSQRHLNRYKCCSQPHGEASTPLASTVPGKSSKVHLIFHYLYIFLCFILLYVRQQFF
jgi:hypothetical protein